MQRLSGMDASFLYMETPALHMHVVGVIVLDPSTMPGGFSYARMHDVIATRFQILPQFRQKLREIPLHLDHPVWVDDPDFDLDRHVTHAALPEPGDLRQLADLVGRVASTPLERDRPLWRMYVVEGLDNGHVALISKLHHSTIDGVTGADIMGSLFDMEPDAPDPDPPDDTWEPDAEPSSLRLASDALVNRVTNPLETGRALARTGRSLLNMAVGAAPWPGRSADFKPALPFSAPRTSFNTSVGARRAIAFSQAQLDDLKKTKHTFGTTVNDVVLAACTMSLRNYLYDRDELPDRPLLCSVPVSVHGQSSGEGTNQVSNMFVRLPVHLDDPVDQLRAVHAETEDAKVAFDAMGADLIQDLAQITPPAVFNLAARLYSSTLANQLPPVQNLIISNVPGPPVPLYIAGARLVGLYPFGPLLESTGVNITVLSNMGNLDIGVIANAQKVDHVWTLADGIREAIEVLATAAGRLPAN